MKIGGKISLKLVLNGSYGAFATQYFILFNEHVAGTITAEGRNLTQTMHHDNEDYWYNQWHLDTELHRNMGIRKISKIEKPDEVSIYADTDSCDGSSIVRTDHGDLTIEDWYNNNIKNGSGGITLTGHESVITNDKILNYSSNNLNYTSVKRIIRHRVNKPKWKLKTKSNKEIVVTNDHSMIVFRDGEKIEVKPSEILQTDKILIIKDNI